MNIILGEQQAQALREKYTVLELDTFCVSDSVLVKSYAVLEHIPIQEMFQIENMSDLHHNMIEQYKLKNWSYCQDALTHLIGRWNGEIDSFYQELGSRIEQFRENDPGESWSWAIDRRSA